MLVAIIIPCLNEQLTIAQVVRDCQMHLPRATVYVLDNGSTDNTADIARKAGAEVMHSPVRGKGNVLRHAFRIIEADFYVMIDGDGTYAIKEGKRLLEIAVTHNYEMVMGSRLEQGERTAFRPMHFLGNRMFTGIVRALFNFPVRDLLTGLRVFSRRFVRETNLVSTGFEIETELTIRAMAQNLAFCEVPIPYVNRPQGSKSKLRTYHDGFKISLTILRLWKIFRPLHFFSLLATITFLVSLVIPWNLNSTLSNCSILFLGLGFYLDGALSLQRMLPKSDSEWSSAADQTKRVQKKSA